MTRALSAAVCLASALALADVAPPDLSGCQGKEAGASCQRDDGSAGTCTKETCSRNDYSNGPPPTLVEYECLRCTATAGAKPGPGADEKKGSCAAAPGLGFMALGALLLRRRRS